MRIAPRRHKDPSSGANRPSDIPATVNINAELNLRLILWQLTSLLNAFQGVSSMSIVRV